MADIYQYQNKFDKANVIDELMSISEEIDEETMKPDDERDRQREFDLIYKQFVKGLKLSTRSLYGF